MPDDPIKAQKHVDRLRVAQQELFGAAYPEEIDPAYSDVQLIFRTGIDYHVFVSDAYTDEQRGMLLARVVIDNQIEKVERWYNNQARAARQNRQRQSQQQQSASAAKPRRRKPQKKVYRPPTSRKPTKKRHRS